MSDVNLLLLIAIIAYWGAKLLRKLLAPPSQHSQNVGGASQNEPPLDLSNQDIEDADFEEIDE